jgi:stress-induced morphogen
MPVSKQQVEKAIRRTLDPFHLEVHDTSDGCGTKFEVIIVSDIFENLSLLQRHRLVHDVLKEEIANMHAFSQVTRGDHYVNFDNPYT